MCTLPNFPEFTPLTLEMARVLSPFLVQLPDGISEFSFAGLYLFRHRYEYRVSCKDGVLLISGKRDGQRFFITPCSTFDKKTVSFLFETHEYWKLISPDFLHKNKELLEKEGYTVIEDRDNFDYLYLRSELASLSGKKFHKKRNHVNAFELSYPDFYIKTLDATTRDDARKVLDFWVAQEEHPENTDYAATVEVLELLDTFEMVGIVLYAQGEPVAWALAETLSSGKITAVHFEKARIDIRGAYQYINYAFARSLSENVMYINREQDLGDEGMRQAKMTYRPVGFVEKYKVLKT